MARLDTLVTPNLVFEEILSDGSTLTNPAADSRKLFLGEDGLFHMKDSAGTVTNVGGGLTDPMTTRGDIIIRNAANTTARLGRGTTGQVLTSDGTDIAWATPSGGGATIQYPSLKPATPTDDFAGASLGGSWSAHSEVGAFTTSHVLTQAIDGSHLAMQFSQQRGFLYQSMSNVDIDLAVGGMRLLSSPQLLGTMPGIAVLNSAGTGVGIVQYNDGNVYLAAITTYAYAGALQTIANGGHNGEALGSDPVWLRIVRSGNNWTGHLSRSGRAWDFTTAASATTITADRWFIGNFLTTTSGQLTAEWIHAIV